MLKVEYVTQPQPTPAEYDNYSQSNYAEHSLLEIPFASLKQNFIPPTYIASNDDYVPISCVEEEVRNPYSKITICCITISFNIFLSFHVIG